MNFYFKNKGGSEASTSASKSSPNNDADHQIVRNLEMQVIDLKFELASSKSSEDYLRLEIAKMKAEMKRIKEENAAYRLIHHQRSGSDVSSNNAEGALSRDVNEAGFRVGENTQVATSNFGNSNSAKTIRRVPSCASGIALLNGSLPPRLGLTALESEAILSDDGQDVNREDGSGNGVLRRGSCSSGIALLRASLPSRLSSASNAESMSDEIMCDLDASLPRPSNEIRAADIDLLRASLSARVPTGTLVNGGNDESQEQFNSSFNEQSVMPPLPSFEAHASRLLGGNSVSSISSLSLSVTHVDQPRSQAVNLSHFLLRRNGNDETSSSDITSASRRSHSMQHSGRYEANADWEIYDGGFPSRNDDHYNKRRSM